MESESLRIKTYILENLSEIFTDVLIISKSLGAQIGRLKVSNGIFYIDSHNTVCYQIKSIDYIQDKFIFIKF